MVTRSFDGLDNVVSEVTAQSAISYAIDSVGRRTTMTVAGQPTITYAYDGNNRLTQLVQDTSAVNFSIDAAGRRTATSLPNGITLQYSYDSKSQQTGISYLLGNTTIGDVSYGYDVAGRRISVGGSLAQTGLPQPVLSATYDAANQLTSWGNTNFAYDANGNLSGEGLNGYAWNARNQMVGMTGNVTGSFQYDGVGRRISKTVNSASTAYVFDQFNVVQELSGGTPLANILSGLKVDEVFARSDANGVSTFLSDALRSTIALTDINGSIQTRYVYEPFGSTTASGMLATNPVQYTGRENDNTGLYYYRARYYDPSAGRFISEDPLRFEAGVNFYSYVGDNPVQYRDPFGQMRDCDEEHIQCFRKCWSKCPPYPFGLKGKGGHYRYCRSKCFAEYVECEAENKAEQMAKFCERNPTACAAAIAIGIGIALQPELAPLAGAVVF